MEVAMRLDQLTIKGFKSIRALENFKLNNINILIGGNGSGKSNFVEIFRMLRERVNENFAKYVDKNGRADGFLFNGPEETKSISAHFYFGQKEYRFEIEPTADERFIFKSEEQKYENREWNSIFSSYDRAYEMEEEIWKLHDVNNTKHKKGGLWKYCVGYYVFDSISKWIVYHFHDTSMSAPMRRSEIVEDSRYLRDDAANIAPFLLRLKERENKSYNDIVNTIRLVMPFFDDFIFDSVSQNSEDRVKLIWQQKGSDYPLQPYHFSDGTIRFICLATVLLQPTPPATIIIDEPELGLHPYAIEILAELVQAAATRTQIVISTQSPELVDCFAPEDIIVVNRKDGASTFKRLDPSELSVWLEDYSLGNLWRKDIIEAGPTNE
ncbi:MAG: AAA family ATPase [Gammaproteobacteria bacterium]|nr:AAA family ATPase [Gammaproteobacteria bacterium]